MQPLDGLTVLDFSTLLPGPMASLFLAEAGARVIKVERPDGGDETRSYPGDIDGQSALFAMLNRGKDSLAIDLKSQDGLDALDPYLQEADILIEQFRPGVMQRLGLGYEALSSRYPRLIYCSITGFGQDGPKAQMAGHDLNYIAATGLLSLSSGPADAPVVPPALIADLAGGTYPAVLNILLALESRNRSGQGTFIDVSMSDNMFPLMWWALAGRAATGKAPGNADHTLSGGTARYHLYPTRDGKILAAAAIEDRFWHTFCDIIDLPGDLRDDSVSPSKTLSRTRDIIAKKSGAEWMHIMENRDCCCNLIASLDEALADPQFASRGVFDARLRIGTQEIAALPVPISPVFRSSRLKSAPDLGSLTQPNHNI